MTSARLYPVLVIAASALFAVNGTASKLVLQAGFDPLQLTTLRVTGAVVGLLTVCLVLRPSRLRVTRGELPLLLVYGLTGFFLVPLLYFVSIARLPVGIALLFEYTAPLFVALWARFGQRARVRPRLWGGLALSLVGLACVAQIWGDLRLDPVGVTAAFAAAILLAGYFLLGARGVQTRDTLSLTCWAFGFAALAGSAARPWWNFPTELLGRTSGGVPVWLLCCYVVVFGSIVPYLLIALALRHLPATSVVIIGMVEPVLAATVAWPVLGEALMVPELLGGVLVLIGVGLAETARVSNQPAPPMPSEVIVGGATDETVSTRAG